MAKKRRARKAPAMRPRMPRMRRMRPQMAPDARYAMRGVVDMSTMAVGGMVASGMIGMVGSLIP